MLGKLIKYEYKSTARIFLPLFAAVLFLALVNKILFAVFSSFEAFTLVTIPQTLFTMMYVFLIIATFIMTLVVGIQRYYKNLLGEEGYLMFTLPVKSSSLILSKGIVAYSWVICSIIITLISVFVMVPSYEWVKEVPKLLEMMVTEFKQVTGKSLWPYIIVGVALVLILIASFIMQVYTSITIGHLSNKHKVLTSFGAYLAIYAILQVINSVILLAFGNSFINNIDTMNDASAFSLMSSIFVTALIVNTVLTVVYFFISKYILKNKLNLE